MMFMLAFVIIFLVYVTYGVMLMYHWFQFAYNPNIALGAAVLYALSGVIFSTLLYAAAASL